jgi:hypothetical protein
MPWTPPVTRCGGVIHEFNDIGLEAMLPGLERWPAETRAGSRIKTDWT